jgi:hypothetical protein
LAFAIQRVLPTSPIYRGPNPTHIEVQICAHKGSKALPTSQRTLAFALDQNSGTQQLDTLAIRTSSLSNWTLWLSAQDFMVVTPQNRATGHSSYPHKSSQATGHSSYPHKSPNFSPRVYAKQDDGMRLHFHSIQKGRISTSSQVDWI